jgi:hypothetical protein
LILGVVQLIFIDLHSRVKLDHFAQEFLDLGFMTLEFAKLEVEVVNVPDCLLVELLSIFIFTVLYKHRNVQVVTAEHFQDLKNLLSDVLRVQELAVALASIACHASQSVEHPLTLLLEFLL